jgi:GT2 family glycosyltransferase
MNSIVSIIILNWNRWQDTVECLESLYQINYPYYNVIVLDNNSKDNSIYKIKNYCKGKLEIKSKFFKYNPENKPIKILEYSEEELLTLNEIKKEFQYLPSNKKIILIKNNKNNGFAEGNNIGIKFVLNHLDTDYILLLNNDTIVDNNFLNELIKTSLKDNKIGFLGPKIYYYEKENIILTIGGSINIKKGNAPSLINQFDKCQYEGIYEFDYLSGACLLINKEVIDKIGLFDPKYFLYWEETDLCLRGSKRGYKCIYVSKSKIWHKHSSSKDNTTSIYFLTRNSIYFVNKHGKLIQKIIFLLYFIGFLFWYKSFIFLIYQKNFKNFHYFLNGTIDGIKIITNKKRS